MLRANEIPVKYATREKNPTNDDNMIYYSEDYPAEYVITVDNERIISLPSIPVGADIVQVELETKPLRTIQWTWNATSRILLLSPSTISPVGNDPSYVETFAGQLLSIIYKIKKRTL